MELFMIVLSYIVVFGSAAAVAGVLAVIVYYVSKKRLSKGWCYFGSVVAVLLILASLSQKPALLYSRDCAQRLSETQQTQVYSVSSGAYSKYMPFIPVAVRMEHVDEHYVAWTEFYFPCGTREMELSSDGFNCRKYLLPW